jgi:hypothetical protein
MGKFRTAARRPAKTGVCTFQGPIEYLSSPKWKRSLSSRFDSPNPRRPRSGPVAVHAKFTRACRPVTTSGRRSRLPPGYALRVMPTYRIRRTVGKHGARFPGVSAPGSLAPCGPRPPPQFQKSNGERDTNASASTGFLTPFFDCFYKLRLLYSEVVRAFFSLAFICSSPWFVSNRVHNKDNLVTNAALHIHTVFRACQRFGSDAVPRGGFLP